MSSVKKSAPGLPAHAHQQAVTKANAARLETALALHKQGQLQQAEVLYKQILQSQPQHFDALQLLATMKVQRNDHAAAVILFDQALAINPRLAVTHNNRGIALAYLKQPIDALHSYDLALQIEPGHAQAHNNRGNALRDLKRPLEAVASYDQALAINFQQADVHQNRGMALAELKRPQEALHSYDQALEITPDDAEAHFNRGNALLMLKRPAQALASFDLALQLKPAHAGAHNSRGNALLDLNRFAQALQSHEQALLLQPEFADAHNNRGHALRQLHRFAEALACFDRAQKIEPDLASAHWNESLCRLLIGDFAAGWQKYEWRWKTEQYLPVARNFRQALWLGQNDLKDKTILLYAEQGLGDTLQFCRYAPQVAALGAKVILEVPAQLKPLMHSLDGVDMVLSQGETLPEFDYQCPLLSLPLAFQADSGTISNASYLQCDPRKRAQWQSRSNQSRHMKVGLAWSGNPEHANDAKRSIPLSRLSAGLNFNEQIDYYCLQKEVCPADQVVLEQTPGIRFFGSEMIDFSDTAALIDLMDLVITVDTSIAHLAGAMGKQVWILLPFNSDWRWLLERTDSPWYQSARIFRQPVIGDWSSVLAQIAIELACLNCAKLKSQAAIPMDKTPEAPAQASSARLQEALALHRQGRLDQAEVLYKQILASQTQHFDALQLLATIAVQRNEHAAAVLLFDRALAINPQQALVHNNRGIALAYLKQPEQALQSYDRALQLQPGHAQAHNNRGNALRDLKRPLEALASFDHALAINFQQADVHQNRGMALCDLKRLAEALQCFEQALMIKPDDAEAHYKRANTLLEMKNPAQALASYEQTLLLKPDHAEACNNRGKALLDLKQPAQALLSFERARQLKPEYAEVHLNESLCLLLLGDFASGWQKHEWRWKTDNGTHTRRTFAPALWLGRENLRHKTILLYGEQGLGDTIQFCRYAKDVAALGATVLLEAPAPLKTLLRSLDGVATLLGQGETLPDFDYHCPLLSLPLAFQTDFNTISGISYLHSAPEKHLEWRSRLHQDQHKKIGLAWSGSAGHVNDANRSIALEQLLRQLKPARNEHISYYCLQNEVRLADQVILQETPEMRFFGSELIDFSDTAALIDSMDLVITVDTSVAHLAGALGKEVWILLPFNPDWRWLLDRTDSPWYRSARLFRQPGLGDWDSVLAQVAAELQIQTHAAIG